MPSTKTTIKILTSLLVLVIFFHLLILLKIIPYTIAWGGRLKTDQEMYVFESVSIVINLLLIFILSLKAKHVKHKIIDITLWIFFVLFSLNTIGNLLAKTTFEKSFSVITLLFAVLLFKILRKSKNGE
jgi:hypothetical protein